MEHPKYAFAWMKPVGKEYITSIIGWSRKEVAKDVEIQNGLCWDKIYRRGGRIIKIKILAHNR